MTSDQSSFIELNLIDSFPIQMGYASAVEAVQKGTVEIPILVNSIAKKISNNRCAVGPEIKVSTSLSRNGCRKGRYYRVRQA